MGVKVLSGTELRDSLEAEVPGSVIESSETEILVDSRAVAGVLRVLKESPDFDFNYLNNLTAVDYYDYFELIYNLTSMKNNQVVTVKARVTGRENPEVPSVSHLWRGADFQEREIFDLLGIRFSGHPNLKRIALWEGFEGHPLRKDFL